MKKKVLITVLGILCIFGAVFAWYLYRMWPMLRTTMGEVEQTEEHQSHMVSERSYPPESAAHAVQHSSWRHRPCRADHKLYPVRHCSRDCCEDLFQEEGVFPF